ncbi:MAG: biopolymer transporter ExbD [Verrucomicrobiota bacterium]
MRLPSLIVHKKARIEIIPLIDIMFFLLASFMMVSLSQVHMKGMKVMLPTGQSGETQPKNNYISVSVNESGNFFFDKQELSYDAMFQRLQLVHQSDPEAKVFVRGDANTVHGNIIRLLDLLRAAGFLKVSFEIKSQALKGVPGPAT